MNLCLNLKLESVESDIPEKKVTALFKILLKNFNLQINCKENMLKNVYKGNKIKLPNSIIVKENKS